MPREAPDLSSQRGRGREQEDHGSHECSDVPLLPFSYSHTVLQLPDPFSNPWGLSYIGVIIFCLFKMNLDHFLLQNARTKPCRWVNLVWGFHGAAGHLPCCWWEHLPPLQQVRTSFLSTSTYLLKSLRATDSKECLLLPLLSLSSGFC